MGPAGRSVRCVRCRTVWFVANTAALSDIAEAHRAEMAQFIATASMADAEAGSSASGGAASAADETSIGSFPGKASNADVENIGITVDAAAGATVSPPPDAGPGRYDRPPAPDESIPIVDSPALVPIEHGAAAVDIAAGEDIETVAARRNTDQSSRRRTGLRPPGLRSLIVALIAANIGLVGWRTDIVHLAPQTASLYAAIGLPVNVRGLVFEDVRTETQTHDGVHVLLVQGTIASTAPRTVEVPRLRLAIRNENGNEIYSWTMLPPRSVLGPGETLVFQSRLASPPNETRHVLVRFFNPRDRGAGIE